MPTYAICHAATRVVRRLTVDDPPPVASDEVAIAVSSRTDIGRQDNGDGTFTYWRVTEAGALEPATARQAVDAGVDERAAALEQRQALDAELDALLADATVPQSVKDVLARLGGRR